MKTPASRLKGKTIVLGVTGGIAVYKACEIVRLLATRGADVHVVMTKGATQFVTPMTFQALSLNPVRSDIFNLSDESLMSHIELADKAKLILVAPATADFMAKMAHGFCDDLLTTVVCATRAPIVIAPAMNCHMWENKIVQENVDKLKKHGVKMIGPEDGSLACGYEGAGRLTEPTEIVAALEKIL